MPGFDKTCLAGRPFSSERAPSAGGRGSCREGRPPSPFEAANAPALDRRVIPSPTRSLALLSPSQLASEALASGTQSLANLPGAVEAGWREYSSPCNGRTVYVNDVTYEEAATLSKVVEKMRKKEEREAAGIHATGRRFDEIEGGEMSLVVCSYCGRKFNPHSIQRHEQVCSRKADKPTMRI